jgi:hypothetical protein
MENCDSRLLPLTNLKRIQKELSNTEHSSNNIRGWELTAFELMYNKILLYKNNFSWKEDPSEIVTR